MPAYIDAIERWAAAHEHDWLSLADVFHVHINNGPGGEGGALPLGPVAVRCMGSAVAGPPREGPGVGVGLGLGQVAGGEAGMQAGGRALSAVGSPGLDPLPPPLLGEARRHTWGGNQALLVRKNGCPCLFAFIGIFSESTLLMTATFFLLLLMSAYRLLPLLIRYPPPAC